MATSRNYYEVLGVPQDADQMAIKDAFRRLALKYHPDRNKEPGAEERFKEIAEAYAVLSDSKKRAEYDARGHGGFAGFSHEDLLGGGDFDELLRDIGFGFGGESVFDRFFRRHGGPRRGADIEMALEVPLQRVLEGGEEVVHVRRPTTCASCQGSGAKAGTTPKPCETCGATGQQVHRQQNEGVRLQQITTCPSCGGRGTIIESYCPTCGGSGRTSTDQALTVVIPVGAEEGMTLRIPNQGMPGHDPGTSPGDLLVIVRTALDPRFQRRGTDLWHGEMLDHVEATLGCEIEIPTLETPVKVVVPPGTQPDEVLRLVGKGLPQFGGGERGDLMVRVQIRIPDQLTPKERDLYRQLRAERRRRTN